MEFCDDCDSLLFLKSNVSEDNLEGKLIYECKMCGFIKDTKESDKCIYTRDHSGEYLSYNILTNPYICEDPTLPILDNIDCPNEKCIVNKNVSNMKNNIILSPVYFNNRSSITEAVQKIMKSSKYEFVEYPLTESQMDWFKTVSDTKPEKILEQFSEKYPEYSGVLDVKLVKKILKDPNHIYSIQNDQTTLTIHISPKLKKTSIDTILKKLAGGVLSDYEVSASRFTRPKRRVTYIKYDKADMRFMYICTHCNTYWKR